MSVIKEKRRGERGAVESDTDIALHACYRKQRSEYTKRERERKRKRRARCTQTNG